MGKVYIVGAGTGRLENLTYKAKRLIEQADIIFYDRLINQNLLLLAKANCQLVDVGKIVGGTGTSQEEIHELIKEASHHHQVVLRLKSGDPYVFGRGGEEANELIEAGIDYEIIPGITTSIGGLTYAGIPVTYRNIALDYHVFTGHAMNGIAEYDWQAVAGLKGTLVFLMGVKALPTIVSSLVAHGKDTQTPVAVIEWASRACQKKVVGDLTTIEEAVKLAGLKPPCLIVVGQVVQFQDQLNFFEQKPLFGKQIALPQSTGGRLFDQLEDLGAEVVLMQSAQAQIIPIQDLSLTDIKDIVFLDVPAIQTFVSWMYSQSLTWRNLGHYHLVAVTEHVKGYLTKLGIGYDQAYSDFTSFNDSSSIDSTMLILGSKEHAEMLANGDQVVITSQETMTPLINVEAVCQADYLVFPNSKAVRSMQAYLEVATNKQELLNKPAFCMGDITQEALIKTGFTQIVTSHKARAQALFESLMEFKKGEM